MHKLYLTAMSESQNTRFHQLVTELNHRHGLNGEGLAALAKAGKLKSLIASEINSHFNPTFLSFDNEPGFTELRETALKEARLIYIPKRGAETIFSSGQPPAETVEVYSIKAEQLEINTNDLPAQYDSVVIVPLVSSLSASLANDARPRHGAIIVAKSVPDGFDPQVDLRIMRMIGNDLAATLAATKTSI